MSQLDDLNTLIAAIGTDVDTVETELQNALTAANANQPVDLSGAIAALGAIRTKLEAVPAATQPGA